MGEAKNGQIRQSNIELLRIISMCMIIAMHYMTKGMVLPKLSDDISLHNVMFRLIFAFCASAVNVYVFISGYFAIDSKWSIGKLIRLWIQVLLYSVMVPVVLWAAGVVDISSMDLGTKQQIFLPISYEHYWFATSYVLLYLFCPVLAVAIDKLDKKQLGTTIAVLLTVFCGFKSVNPYLIPWDKYGDDVIWFMVLYLIAGYIRLYGVPFIDKKDEQDTRGYEDESENDIRRKSAVRRGLAVYIISSVLTFAIALVVSFIVRNTGKLEYYMDMTLCYNYITVLIASVGLFCAFKNLNIGSNGFINRIAGYTFGVYLLHENIVLRDLWPGILGIGYASGRWWQIIHMIVCIIVVFTAGCIIDSIRAWLFGKVR